MCILNYKVNWINLLLLLLTAIELSLGGSTAKQVRKHTHKRNNTKNTVQTIQNTVNTSALIRTVGYCFLIQRHFNVI
jgi:hypothetical protein